MKRQLSVMYFVAVFVPLFIMAVVLISLSINKLLSYEQDMTVSNNHTVRSTLYEITSQVYNISEEIVYSDNLATMLSGDYQTKAEFIESSRESDDMLSYYSRHFSAVDSVKIYLEGNNVTDTGSFVSVDPALESPKWYEDALDRFSVSWTTIRSEDIYGNVVYHLALVRRIPLFQENSKAVLVIKINENYLRNRMETEQFHTILSTMDGMVAYSTNRADCGQKVPFDFPENNSYYEMKGTLSYQGDSYISYVSTLGMVKSDSYIHITTLSLSAHEAILHTVLFMILLVAMGMLLPAFIMRVFISDIVHQVGSLRNEMSKASMEDYDLNHFEGCYELTEAYRDLQILIERIKDRDARMYENEIAEQKLLNEQQNMEFKMLASQINPHFLYNTLEMIRMKALAAGDKETATAIRLLGQSMRYVLSNTGTEYTTLSKELKHIETYLQIQKLRFGDRVNYELIIEEGIETDYVRMLPLLLQPIVENAVLHGLEEVEEDGKITVYVHRNGSERLCIDVTDNGCGMDEETLSEMRRNLVAGHINNRYGIGLYNINQRLRMSYGEDYGITIDSRPGAGTTVCASIHLSPIVEDSQ